MRVFIRLLYLTGEKTHDDNRTQYCDNPPIDA
jgi:hypothetical protein